MTSALAVEITNESEVAYVQSGGNSEVQTTNVKSALDYRWDRDHYRLGGHYLYGESEESVSARNWDLLNKYERELTKYTSITLAEHVEGNRFTGVKARYNSDIGMKYYHLKSDKKKIFSEVGYRYTIEDRYAPVPTVFYNRGRVYNELDHTVSEKFRYKVWLEYIPNFTENDDYMFNGEASLTTTINSNFSLKVAYAGTYDSRPVTENLKNYDYNITTALVMKY